MRQYYQMAEEELRDHLNASQEALSEEQVREHQKIYGLNELQEGKKKSTLQIFLQQYQDFLVIILIAAAIISGFLGDVQSTAVILIVITMNAVLGTAQTIKAEQSLKSLKKMSAPKAKVLRNGGVVEIPSAEVTVGDEIFLDAGDCIPADGRILNCVSLKVDESALTGESVPVEKNNALIEQETSLGDRSNMLYSGCFVTYGRGRFLVTAVGMETEVGKIAGLLKTTSDKQTPLQKSLDEFGKKLSILILIFCGILFAISALRGDNVGQAFLFAVALAVAAIPEALSSIVTIVLSFGTQKMAREHAIIRKLQAVEGLGSVSVICSDKTGTLTQNKMTVEDYYIDGEQVAADDVRLDHSSHKFLLEASILCNDSTVTEEGEIGDPTETALLNLGEKLGIHADDVRSKYPKLAENLFDSDRKMMSTLHEVEGRQMLLVKGAVDVLMQKMTSIRINGQTKACTEADIEQILRKNNEFSKEGLRVLAFAYREMGDTAASFESDLTVEDEEELTFLGLIAMMDPPREESMEAVRECKEAGIRPIMITGDHKVTAAAIAKRIGILKDISEACEGAVLDGMNEEQLKNFVPGISVYARVSPEHKIRIVRAWQERGNIVAMTGDGVNDAPALKQADIGVAMGITGSEVSKDAAAMVLTDDNFATIVKAVENGRNLYRNIKNAIRFLLSGNFGAILAVLFASIVGLPLPFAPVHLLFINLLTDSLPAIALGLEPHTSAVMNEKPRPKEESILNRNFLIWIGAEGFIVGATTVAAFLIGYHSGGSLLGSTMAFGTLCTARLVHGYNCKSDHPVIFRKEFFNNKYLQGAFLQGLLLITSVLILPQLSGVFKVQTLDLKQLGFVYGLAFLNLSLIQLLKWIITRTRQKG